MPVATDTGTKYWWVPGEFKTTSIRYVEVYNILKNMLDYLIETYDRVWIRNEKADNTGNITEHDERERNKDCLKHLKVQLLTIQTSNKVYSYSYVV